MDGNRPRLAHYPSAPGKGVELPPGRYTVVGRGLWGMKECALKTLDLGPGDRKEITLRLEEGGCR